MLKQIQIEEFCDKLRISPQGRAYLTAARQIAPSRPVTSRGRSRINFPSVKMGRTLVVESPRCELAWLKRWEADPSVLEFWDQPPPVRISWKSGTRHHSAWRTPDFLLLTEDGCRLIDCKEEDDLTRLSDLGQRKYEQAADGSWQCPPMEAAAAEYGFQFQVLLPGGEHDI
jgi:putative transposase